MDQNTLITILGSTFAIIISMFTMFLWVRSEANNDRRTMQAVQREDRKDILELIRSIDLEIKDFHNRLCLIEKERKLG
jgi:heme/copper-type cytochrome/quinol oxidase subunit 2